MCWLSGLERFLCWFRIGAWLLIVVCEVNSQCGSLAVCALLHFECLSLEAKL